VIPRSFRQHLRGWFLVKLTSTVFFDSMPKTFFLVSLLNGGTFPAFSVIFGTVFNVFFDITMPVEDRRWEISKMCTFCVSIS
jgi:hypothetical protein